MTGPQALRLHATMLAGVAGCAAAGWFEWTRALHGHEVAWVYAFEWPLFAAMGVYVWWKLLHADSAGEQPQPTPDRPAAGKPVDEGLAAWEDYLARLHAVDPPGAPPAR